MRVNRPIPSRKPRRWGWMTCLAGSLIALMLTLWAGCSPARNYKTLSFFFDGVPDPNAPQKVPGSDEESGPAAPGGFKSPVVSVHKPFAEGQCSSCHKQRENATFEFAVVKATICIECHKDVARQYPVMHAPVAAQACLWCHEAHDSPNKHLLRQADASLCLQCHERPLLLTDVKQHNDPKAVCLDCHLGHGSAKPGMLRPGVDAAALLAPATRPSGGGEQ